MSDRLTNLRIAREGPSKIRLRVDRELAVVLVFPGLVLIALLIALVRYANLPENTAQAPAPAAPAVSAPAATAPSVSASAAPTTPAVVVPAPAPVAPREPRRAPEVGSGTAPKRTYRLVAGDTLASVALRFGVDYQRIAADNQLDNPNRIRVGQLLRIGTPTPGVQLIRPGDTLTGLAKTTGLGIRRLLELNRWITDPSRIPAGAGLRLRA
jgi:LysM repeat protein